MPEERGICSPCGLVFLFPFALLATGVGVSGANSKRARCMGRRGGRKKKSSANEVAS